MKKKFLTYAMTGALSLGVIGGAALPTFAATNQQQTANYENLDTETQQKVEEILSSLQQELADLGVSFKKWNGLNDKFANLDDEKTAQAQEIMQQVKDGSLTQEEANTQLETLGVSLPDRKFSDKGDLFANLDDETKAQAQEIMQQLKDGSLTPEEAHTQLEALGVSLPERTFGGKDDLFADLDEETKAQAQEIMQQLKDGSLTHEEAHTQLEALGVSLPDRKDHGKGLHLDNLDDETKEEVEALVNEAKEQLDELGAEFPAKQFNRIAE